MRILLLGERSAFHQHLKDGLRAIGHDAIVAGTSDGYKEIACEVDLDTRYPGAFGALERRVRRFRFFTGCRGFDVVQLISPFFMEPRLFPRQYSLTRIIDNNDRVFLSACGSDAYYWRYSRERLRYGPFDDTLKYDLKSDSHFMSTDKALRFNQWVVQRCAGVIPVMYDYEVGYRHEPKRKATIPLPINTDNIEYKDNIVTDKLVILHGLSRLGFKGTRHVEKAFQSLQKKYPNDLRLVIAGNMPLREYLHLLESANIVVDQVNSFSYGMNALFSMAMGKVVMGGCEPECLRSLRVDSAPVINITPDSESLIKAVEGLLDKRSRIWEIGVRSRKFVESIHNHKIVAQQYASTWRL